MEIGEFLDGRLNEMVAREVAHDGYAEGCPAMSGWRGGVCDCGNGEIEAELHAAAEGIRPLVRLHVETMWCSEGPMCDVCKEATGIGDDHEGEWPCLTLRHVASIWSSHPDFDLAWQPGTREGN